MLDLVVDRRDMKATIARALRFMRAEPRRGRRARAGAGRSRPRRRRRQARRLTSQLLDRLFALETFGIKLGLENITRLCEALGHPERSFTSLHVAGTNGKGSVTAMAHAALRAAGVRAGALHLAAPDRSDRALRHRRPRRSTPRRSRRSSTTCWRAPIGCSATGALPVHADVLRGDDRDRRSSCSAARASRSAVIEVGLGGRFDATNVLTPVAGAITTIGFDHQQHLGDTLERDRVREGRHHQAGHDRRRRRAAAEARRRRSRRSRASAARALVEAARGRRACDAEMHDGRARVTIETPHGTYGPVTLGACAASTRSATRSSRSACSKPRAERGVRDVPRRRSSRAWRDAEWPARLELITLDDGRQVLLDAAHNPEGARALAAYLRDGIRSGRRSSSASCATRTWRTSCAHAAAGDLVGDRHRGADAARHARPTISRAHLRAAGARDVARRARRRRARSSWRSSGADGVRRGLDLPRRRRARRPQAACYPAVIPRASCDVLGVCCLSCVVCLLGGDAGRSRSRPISRAPQTSDAGPAARLLDRLNSSSSSKFELHGRLTAC